LRCEQRNGRVIMITFTVHELPVVTASVFQLAMPMPESESATDLIAGRLGFGNKKAQGASLGLCFKQQTKFQLWQLVRRIQRVETAADLRRGPH
jgi:hypothetical protein